MLILWKLRRRDPDAGYVPTFERQMADVLGDCLDAGRPRRRERRRAQPARAEGAGSRQIGAASGRVPRVAVVEGDDLTATARATSPSAVSSCATSTPGELARRRRSTRVATANAYLGGFGIAAALDGGRRRRRHRAGSPTRRSSSAPRRGGTAGRRRTSTRSPARSSRATSSSAGPRRPVATTRSSTSSPTGYPGFPICEVAADGSFVVTKQPGTGGAVTVGTVTAQLLYELGAPRYDNPDAAARFDTIQLAQVGPDRVGVTGHAGRGADRARSRSRSTSTPGYRNTMTLVLTGLDVEAKAAHATSLLLEPARAARRSSRRFDVQLCAPTTTTRRPTPRRRRCCACTVMDTDKDMVGRRFSNAVTELALASYAGFYTTTPPTDASAYGVYWPLLVPARRGRTTSSCCPTATRVEIPHADRRRADRSPPRRRLRARRRSGRRRAGRSATCAGRARATRAATRTSGCGRAPTTRTAGSPRPSPSSGSRRCVTEAAELEVRRYELAEPARAQLRRGRASSATASRRRRATTPRQRASASTCARAYLDVPDALVASATLRARRG